MPSPMLAPVLAHSLLALLRPCPFETYQILQCLPHSLDAVFTWAQCIQSGGTDSYSFRAILRAIFDRRDTDLCPIPKSTAL